jgi:hypothetical protein
VGKSIITVVRIIGVPLWVGGLPQCPKEHDPGFGLQHFERLLQDSPSFDKLYFANDALVSQLEIHRKNVETNLKVGTAPCLDLLKTDVELSHAIENRFKVKNDEFQFKVHHIR